LMTSRGKEDIYQGITEITPEYIRVASLSHHWDYGISTKSVPPQTVEAILRKRVVDKDNPNTRLALARFFIQAEYYQQAFAELAAIGRDFPQHQTKAASVHQGLVLDFGRTVLRELNLRMEAGQYQLAEAHAQQILANQIGGTVLQETKRLLQSFEQRR